MRGDITVNGKKMTVTDLVELYLEVEEKNNQLKIKLEEVCEDNEELKRELRVKEDLDTIRLAMVNDDRPSIDWYENRYQSDCVTINQLNVTIDVLIDKLARLRKSAGL